MSNGIRNAQQIVWQALHAAGRSMILAEIAEASGLPKKSVQHCLQMLRKRGYAYVTSDRVYHGYRYKALRDAPPPNLEGLSPESRNYHRGKSYAAKLRRAATGADGTVFRLNVKKHLGCDLARCWTGVKEAA